MGRIHVIGDTHLGKTFRLGTPLHRRGEQEANLWKKFVEEVQTPDVDYNIHLGDLLDASHVPYDLILNVAEIYAKAARWNPTTNYIVLQGNHDIIRDMEKRSAFDLFAKLVEPYQNISVVRNKAVRFDEFACVGFDPLTPCSELLGDDLRGCHTLYSHNDVETFGSQEIPNLVPTKRASELGIKTIITGHVHKPSQFERDGVNVIVHGSLRPFAHGQEINDDLYITLTLDEALRRTDLKNKCVRITLEADEVLDQQIDCLQLTLQRKTANVEAAPEVELGEFNMVNFFQEAFSEVGLTPNMSERVLEEYERRHLAGTD